MKRRFHTNVELLAEPIDDEHIVNIKWVRDNIGELAPSTLSLVFEFSDPLTTGDFVEITAPADCTISPNLEDAEYVGTPETDDMEFELTEQPSGDPVGELLVEPGNVVTLTGPGAEIAAGTVLRMTASNIVGGTVSPGAIINIVAKRKAAPATVGRYVHEQTTAAAAWSITHNLGFAFVLPQVVNSAGNTVIADIVYLSNDSCRLDFAQAVSGTAILRR